MNELSGFLFNSIKLDKPISSNTHSRNKKLKAFFRFDKNIPRNRLKCICGMKPDNICGKFLKIKKKKDH